MHWVTVFDLDQAGFTSWSPIVGAVVFVVFGCIVASGPGRGRFVGILFVVIGVPLSLLSIVVGVRGYFAARQALHDGRVETVEGWVLNFGPVGRGGEMFDVGGKRFQISDEDLSPGFHV